MRINVMYAAASVLVEPFLSALKHSSIHYCDKPLVRRYKSLYVER